MVTMRILLIQVKPSQADQFGSIPSGLARPATSISLPQSKNVSAQTVGLGGRVDMRHRLTTLPLAALRYKELLPSVPSVRTTQHM